MMLIKRSVAWMAAAQTVSFLAQFGSSIVVARYMSPHDLGVYAIALATVAVLSIIQSFGFQPLLVREPVLTESLKDSAFTANAVMSAVLSSVVFVSSYIAPALYNEFALASVLRILAIIPLVGIPAFLPGALLEREGRFKELALITATVGIVSSGVTTLLAASHFGVVSLAYANVVGTFVLTTLLCMSGRKYFRVHVTNAEWRRVFGFGSQIFVASSLVNLSPRFGEIVLGRVLGLSALGVFNRANNVCNMVWGGIHPIIARVVLVDFAQVYRNEGSLRKRYISTVTIVTGLLWPAFAGLAVIAEPFIVLVYGARWVGVAPVLTLLSLASAILVMSTVAWEVCTVTGNVGTQIRIESIRLVVSLGLLICGALISLEAVAASRIVEAVITYFLYRPHLDRLTETRLRDFSAVYAKGAIMSVGAASPAFVIFHLLNYNEGPAVLLIAAIGLGTLGWATLLFVVRHPLANELSAVARKVIRLINRHQ